MREKKYKEELDNLIKEQRLLDQNQVRTLNPSGYIPTPEEYELYLQQQKANAMNTLNNNNIREHNTPLKEKDKNETDIINKNSNNSNPQLKENYYDMNIINKSENYHEQQPEIKYSPEEINQYKYNQQKLTEKEEYNNYGNIVPQSYEEYQRLIEKEKYGIDKINNQKYMNELPKDENEYNNPQLENIRQKMIDKEMYENEDKIREMRIKEAEEEYLKNVKKYEDIIQDNPEQRFKLPPPPFGSNNIPSLNKMSIESQLQGASTGTIDKTNLISQNPYSINNYSLGETDLKQNPIVHPVNSYQFDYNRLYNPLTNKKP